MLFSKLSFASCAFYVHVVNMFNSCNNLYFGVIDFINNRKYNTINKKQTDVVYSCSGVIHVHVVALYIRV